MADAANEFEGATRAMTADRARGYAVRARYDRSRGSIVIGLSTDIELRVLVSRVPALAGAPVEALRDIEISPSGLGLHWPRLDVDLYIPALARGILGGARDMDEPEERRAAG
jgi:hypothetical protein